MPDPTPVDVARPPIPPRRFFLWVLLIAGLLALSLVTVWSRTHRPVSVAPPAVLFELPDFALTDRDGKTLSRRDLLGEPWIAAFIFTRCGGVCPLITEQMQALGKRFPPTARVARVSVTVDPEYDTPPVLAAYAEAHGVGSLAASRWHFVTGPPARVRELILRGFKLALEPGATAEEPILHSTRLGLVDRRAAVRGVYEYDDPAAIRRLLDDLDAVLAERPE